MSWTYRFKQWTWYSLDWVFPPLCGGCDRLGYRWCPDCRQQVKLLPEPVCDFCGIPLSAKGKCPDCIRTRPPFLALRSWVVFEGPIRKALHKLKYRRNVVLGDTLARELSQFVADLGWPIDKVVPVPLSRQRMVDRGYNQVGLIASPMASLNDWDYAPRGLNRIRDTQSQVGLSAAERRTNVEDAFSADMKIVAGKTILLMDDVATTGATLSSCALALQQAGARGVYAFTLARALPHHGFELV